MIYYLVLSPVLGILFYLYCVIFEDLLKGPDFKFGYNYKNPIIIWVTLLLMAPIVNAIVIGLISVISIRYWIYKYQTRNEHD